MSAANPVAPASRILASSIAIETTNAGPINGRLEYYPSGHSLVVFDDAGLAPKQLEATGPEAAEAVARLGANEVLLSNWAERRGVAASLQKAGLIEPTGRTERIGMFGLEGVVVRVL